MEEWYSLYKGGTGEIEEKKSRFIANIAKVSSTEEANDFINAVKKRYWDAKHNCIAYCIGDAGEATRCSDDGEPAGTAGRPMLEVLTNEKITNVCVVVTRYFGGVLLGTGGLVRAYQRAVKEGLKNCSILKKQKGMILKVTCEYTDLSKLQYIADKKGYYIDSTEYKDKPCLTMIAADSEIEDLKREFLEASSGRAVFNKDADVTFAVIDNKREILKYQ